MKQLVLIARLVFGAWMLANGANHFFFSFWSLPVGHEPLAIQLMDALVHSHLIDVAMAIQLITGALILAGVLVPVALCVVMPVSTCAVYWSVILDHQPLGAVLALAALALNGFLMFAYLDYYRGALQRHARMLGEYPGDRATYDFLFVNPGGRASRSEFVPAVITVLVVVLFYAYLVTGRTAIWCLLVVLYPTIVLHARRLRDMGQNAWLVLAPAVLMVVAFAIWLKLFSLGAQLDSVVPLIALVVSAGFALWGCIGKERVAQPGY
jgi:uncharacterized membrane protein YhaH (DUF805 family)